MIVAAGAISGSAICEQPAAEAKTPGKRKITALADQQSQPEAR